MAKLFHFREFVKKAKQLATKKTKMDQDVAEKTQPIRLTPPPIPSKAKKKTSPPPIPSKTKKKTNKKPEPSRQTQQLKKTTSLIPSRTKKKTTPLPSNTDEVPTLLGMKIPKLGLWDKHSKPGDEPPTKIMVNVTSQWKVILVVTFFLVVALIGGPYAGYRVQKKEKIASLYEQSHSAILYDTYAGYREARRTLTIILRLDSRQREASILLAMVEGRLLDEYGSNIKFSDGIRERLESLGDKPVGDLSSHLLWARFYLAGKFDDQILSAINKGLRNDPNEVSLIILAAKAASCEGNYETSYKWLRVAASKQPNNLRVLSQLAEVEIATNRKDRAKTHLKRILSIDSIHVRSVLALAGLRLEQNQNLDLAQRDLDLVLNLPQMSDRNRSQAHFLLAGVSFAQGDRSRGLNQIESALAYRADDVGFKRQLTHLCSRYRELDKALELHKQVQNLDGDKLSDQIFQAAISYRRGQPKTALEVLNSLYKEFGRKALGAEYFVLRGEVFLALQKHKAAFLDLLKVPPKAKANLQARALRSLALLGLKRPSKARKLISKMLKEDPDFALGHFALAHYRLVKRSIRAAKVSLSKALELDPQLFQAHQLLAQIHLQKTQWDQSVQELQLAIAANPYDVDSHLQLGKIYLDNDDPQNALSAYTQLTQRVGDHAQAYCGMAEAQLAMGQIEEAKAAIEKSRAAGAKDAHSRHVEGRIYLADKQFQRALETLKVASVLQKNDPEILADYGLAHLGNQSLRRAETYLNKSIRLGRHKRIVRAQNGLAQIFTSRGAWQKAAKAYEQAAQQARNKDLDDQSIARFYLSAGQSMIKDKKGKHARYGRARRLFRMAAKYAPHDPEPLFEEATTYDEERKPVAAKRSYHRVLELSPEHAFTLYRLGQLELETGQNDRARQLLNKFLETNPEQGMADQARKIIERIHEENEEASHNVLGANP